MKIKSIIIITFVGIIAFVLGVIFQNNVIMKKNKRIENQIIKLLKEDNESIRIDIYQRINSLNRYGGDTNSEIYNFLLKMDSIEKYFKKLHNSNNTINQYTFDYIYSIIQGDIPFSSMYEIAKEVNIEQLSTEEATLYLNLLNNILLRRYFMKYNENYSVGFSRGRCLFVPKNDTVKIGNVYENKIYIEIRDLAKSFTLEFEDGNIYKDSDNIYREVATKKGLNVRRGELHYLDNWRRILLPFEFSFYVE